MYIKFSVGLLYLVVALLGVSVQCFEFMSIPSAVIGGLATVGNFAVDRTVCKLKECCDERHIPHKLSSLESTLRHKLYGQHIALDTVVKAITAHFSRQTTQKALTLSLHGGPGVGKNYITKFIKDSLYEKKADSKFVHHFIARYNFPESRRVADYKADLYNWIKGNVSACPYQLFIFDEVDKMPAGVLDVIKPMIDYNENVDKIDFRKCIFIFLSNTGGSLITKRMMELWREGRKRYDIELRDFESIIAQGSFNEEGGFHHSDTIKSNLIDHYIPFMPLELEQVRYCVLDQFREWGISQPTEKYVDDVISIIEWGPTGYTIYSKTGCKRISQKVAMTVQDIYSERDEL